MNAGTSYHTYHPGMRIIFFDIDGTLLRSGGAGKAAMHTALTRGFGLDKVREDINFSGRTDPGIGYELMKLHDIEPSDDNLAAMQSLYLDTLAEQLPKHRSAHVLPGVRRLLDELAGLDDVTLALLTGNVERGARIKLEHFGLWDYFRFGGFGDGRLERDDVARAAIAEAEAHLGHVDASKAWVIGDTPLDVRCARTVGAKVLAVATGWHNEKQLAECEPDLMLADLKGVTGETFV